MDNNKKPVKVLFVCMGNICRSPSAEAVMNKFVKDAGLQGKIISDSAGTIAYHEGEPADARMQQHAKKRGIFLNSISRPVNPSDFDAFNYIIVMDDENYHSIQSVLPSVSYLQKITRMTDYCQHENPGYVPDPYYGGDKGFELVLDLLEDACNGLLQKIIHDHGLT